MYNFNITNKLPNNSTPLGVDCHTAGEDLGKKLLYATENFHWEFMMFSWQSLAYFCDFWWLEKKKSLLVFHHDVAFKYCINSGFFGFVNECRWYVKEDGFYVDTGIIINGLPEKIASW
ncbi:OLC1v1038146C1 [Oldenlandia corymbosa var. corymbosa]|uniref:S-protein homolog n=1 Tax=Oldenlandia corymbosa var. corymbosa TaxID=529605 RepID=A0AAV1CZT1_OLDCO|nr:OLC1v1038146C1 [Oldenlandia corymbosa var. corymbosa]